MSKLRPSCPWQLRQIDCIRQQVNGHLDALQSQGESGVDARLHCALDVIVELERHFDAESQLKRFLFIIAALAHHARWGGLSDRDATQLSQLAEAILLTHGVDKETSTISILWGELQVAQSQVLRHSGKAWDAAWGQFLSQQVSRRNPVGNDAYHKLVIGLRCARLGLLAAADASLQCAEAGDLPQLNREQARLGRMRCARLRGEFAELHSLIEDFLNWRYLSALAKRDAQWEVCLAELHGGKHEKLLQAVGRNGEHRHPTFLIEAYIWARACRQQGHQERVPQLRTIRRQSGGSLMKSRPFRQVFRACESLENAYLSTQPLAMRLENVNRGLGGCNTFANLDKEMLFRAAVFRWLYRAKQLDLAAFVLTDYQARCRSLSDGRSDDVCGVLGDVDRQQVLQHLAPQNRQEAS